MRLTCVTALVLSALASCGEARSVEGCQTSSDCPGEGDACLDHACHACDEDLPPPNDPCLPKCGNSLGVGMPCTLNGGECNGSPDLHGKFCTIDQVADADLIMCTGPCVDDSDCGEDAVCRGDPADDNSPHGCVPAACA